MDTVSWHREEIEGVAEVTRVTGIRGSVGPVTLLLDVPHGATRAADYQALVSKLKGSYDKGLVDFFHVNTDAGAPECAEAAAQLWAERRPGEQAVVLRSRLPRTFIDCNRIVDGAAAPGMTPGVPPWVVDAQDLTALTALHARWRALTTKWWTEVCGGGGCGVALHTYAPRSVDVVVDADIVANLRRAWSAEEVERWPMRPEVDLITRLADGTAFHPVGHVEAARRAFEDEGFVAEESRTYPLHPATLGFELARPYPSRSLALEVRRDLLSSPWSPFTEKRISPVVATRVGRAVVAWAESVIG